MTSHLEETLKHDVEQIQDLIAKMSRFEVQMLRDCVMALGNGDRDLASLVILRDQRVDQMEKEIDQLCLEFLVRHQPAGGHLRFAYAALQINFQLERIGDYAESIARQIIKLAELNCRTPTALFNEITSASISMLHNAVTAFVRQDNHLAEVTGQMEEQVDVLRNQVNTELMHLVQTSQIPLAALTPLMTIARRFERVSDQAKSICQETIYLCTGAYAKHAGTPFYRVLFVDEHHGCLSRIAEAIGRALGRSDVEFNSAGVKPEGLPAGAVAALQEKGLSIEALNRRDDLSDFDQFQLVVALSPAAKSQLPQPSRKSAQLAWAVADPCSSGSGPARIGDQIENVYRTLTPRIAELVRKLVGEEVPKI